MEKNKKTMQECPLCKTMLPYERWLKVVGVYEEQQKHKKKLESQLKESKSKEITVKKQYEKFRQQEKEMKTQLVQQQKNFEKEKNKISIQAKKEERRILQQKFQKEREEITKRIERRKGAALKKANLDGIAKGIQKQKARTENVSKLLDKTREERNKAMERTKKLEEMMKKGTTPQLEGLDFEDEILKKLKEEFPEDKIEPTGQKGDILQIVQKDDKEIGKILYECKKTKEFESKFIEKIRQDKNKVFADYGVIVTCVMKDDKQSFCVEEDVIIVHPYGTLYVARFLRDVLIRMYTLNLSKEELEEKGRAILKFMQSEEYRARVQSSINKNREAYEVLKKEVKTHIKDWEARSKIYRSIHVDMHIIEGIVQYILLHGEAPQNIPEIEELPPLSIPPKEKQEERKEDADIKDIPF